MRRIAARSRNDGGALAGGVTRGSGASKSSSNESESIDLSKSVAPPMAFDTPPLNTAMTVGPCAPNRTLSPLRRS
jgi:hypothetical protein